MISSDMSRVLDILALALLALAVGVLTLGIYIMGSRDDVGALFCMATGVVLLRSSVDLLRPRSAG
jgi:NADH:ubiquinone oxidoreductase subunit D